MTTRLLTLIGMTALLWIPTLASAEGLLYKLPADGTWVRFEMDGKGTEPDGKEVTLVGHFTMSSVGTVEVDGQKCRWIELHGEAKRSGGEFTEVHKLLIPEKELAAGRDPLKHVLKVWNKHSMVGDEPTPIEDPSGEGARYLDQIRPMLHGPFDDPKELDPIRIDSKLGQLDCAGVIASEKIDQGGGATVDATYTIRLHDKAPFGVVTWEAKGKIERDGKAQGTVSTTWKLVDFGADAKSAIPDAQ